MVAVSSAELLAGERLRPLWLAAHRRLEETGGRLAGVAVHLRGLGDDERTAVDRLLGVRSRGRTVRIELEKLDALLRERVGGSLEEVVSEIVGAIKDRPGERAAISSAEQAMWDRLFAHPGTRGQPRLEEWLAKLRNTGSWRRLEEPEMSLTDALAVLDHLPQVVRRGRSNLAARVLGDAHALDDDSPVGRLVLAALACLDGTVPPLRAADRRRLWADQGVISDETSSTVLTLGLRPMADGPLTEAAALWASSDVPLPIPLAAVQSERWRVPAGTPIWICENPSVLAAATGTGATVISLDGRPSVAANLLLAALAECGAVLRYHGDFGGGGISIANQTIGQFGALPWRFGFDDHALALDRAIAGGTALRPLRGQVPDARWDAALAPAIRAAGVEIEEEMVLDFLLADLAER